MNKQLAIGIDVGGSALKCGLVAEDGSLLYAFTETLKKMQAKLASSNK
ncbi:hypothetical protein LWM68_19235 [Niabella sp. W65]|nr:hypothetical protein [Niabella sp. W65]MCH7364701.1 hypothetical protein [Niabella sp. W65]ULT40551.1 hypothetical protein KRR40_38145 [Niabella sp. I65]